jgi:hypothetical protein
MEVFNFMPYTYYTRMTAAITFFNRLFIETSW